MTRDRYRHEKSTGKPGGTFGDLQNLVTQMAFDGVPNDARVHELKVGTFGMRLEVNWTTVVGESDDVEPREEDDA